MAIDPCLLQVGKSGNAGAAFKTEEEAQVGVHCCALGAVFMQLAEIRRGQVRRLPQFADFQVISPSI